LRRVAHYDYWSDKVRRSVLLDAKADLLLYGNAERAVVALAHRLAAGEAIDGIRDLRGTAFMVPRGGRPDSDWTEIDSTAVDVPGPLIRPPNPYGEHDENDEGRPRSALEGRAIRLPSAARGFERARTVVRLPSFEQVKDDPVLYAHASRTLHLESNPGNARALVQAHGERDVWLNPPPIPLATPEMDGVYGLPYRRRPHPAYGDAKIPAWEMIRFSVSIMRGCFGGCTFCSITGHEGRIVQNRSEASILREIEEIRDATPGFTGVISDLGGPTANMYRLGCRDERIESACRRLSCVHPDICGNLDTDHAPLVKLYRKARALPGVKRVLIGSGLRYDLAVRSPEYVRELVTHHVGGYLKIAPEHTEPGPLAHMMKPGIGVFDSFKRLFDRFSREAGKEQYLIPYFIAAHPGATDEDMLALALWLKSRGFRVDQVQTFLPTPMALATTMYHTGRNPLRRIDRRSPRIETARAGRQRKLHKAFLRYHDPENWPLLREALRRMGRADLIGSGKKHLVPR
ncbi:MAG: YgiQ family radical SAM protein, partial [Azoarcus sp.]|nr:YgiQ family radical SAM protein [Azoarcus sp.]